MIDAIVTGSKPFWTDMAWHRRFHIKNDNDKNKNNDPVFQVTRQVSAFIKQRNYNSAVSLLSQQSELSIRQSAQLMVCLSSLHEFHKLADTFEAMSDKAKTYSECGVHYLKALANLGEPEKLCRYVEERALAPHHDFENLLFLVRAYPFVSGISDRVADLVSSRILAFADYLTEDSFNALLRWAHDLVSGHRYEEFYRLMKVITDLDLSPGDHAKLQVLSAQAAFVRGRYDLQFDALNRVLKAYKLDPIATTAPDKPLDFNTLYSTISQPSSVQGPLISVLMTSYNSADTIEYAVRSILAQTYGNFELIIINDASMDDSRAKIRALCAQDARLKCIDLDINGGTYVAKNHGLNIATGVFATCHDSDDWAHPQKLERLAAALQDNPNLVAVSARQIRYDPVRGFRGRNGYMQLDAPSLMYRRQKVMDVIGFYDSVRAGADTEHEFRIQRAFGRQATKVLPELLTLFLWSEKSLTGGGVFAIDDDAGIFSAPRSAYRRAYCHWQEGAPSLYMGFPLEKRPFEIPPEMKP